MSVPGAKAFRVCFAVLLLILCACEPEPTPLPSILPTAQPTQGVDSNATPAPLRYAVDPYLFAHMTEQDRSQISASAEILSPENEPSQDDLGILYDIIIEQPGSFVPDGTVVSPPLQISLLINTSLSPLDDPALAEIVRRAVYLPLFQQILRPTPFPGTPTPTFSAPTVEPNTLRSELANAGYPDGFDLTLFSPFVTDPAGIIERLTNDLARLYGIEVRLVAAGEAAHLTITNLPTNPNPDAILLYVQPISYRAIDGLTITFTPSGFPIASR